MSALKNLRAFALAVLDDFPDSVPDGFEIQDLAVEHGLLVAVIVAEPCEENCSCADYGDFPQNCYRKSKILLGKGKAP